jgi:hypothetical protein
VAAIESCFPVYWHKKSGPWPLSLRPYLTPLDDYHAFFLVKLLEHHFYDLALLGRHEFADVSA